ncbi:MAG: VCBS repeat-containing protein [Acidobacteria bacterium]|nr:VCBS repeat-containing protein [Acidobacteriota bacterium]
MKNRVRSLSLLFVILFTVAAAAGAAWRLPAVKVSVKHFSRAASEISRKAWRNLLGAGVLAAEPTQQQLTTWPTLAEQLQKSKVRPGTALEKLIQENQEFTLLRQDEISDKRGLPPWLRVWWRKAHPELTYSAADPIGGYPHVLKEVLEWMEWHQDLRSGMGLQPLGTGQQNEEEEEEAERLQAPNSTITNEQRVSGAQTTARSESDIRINFFDPTKIISASNAITASGQQAVFYSTNSGVSWAQTALALQSGDAFHSDPTVDWTSDGRAWSSTLGIDASSTVLKLRNYFSTNNGAAWTFETTPSGTQTSVDKQMVWVDHSATSPYFNRMYAIWHNGNPAYMNRRTAGVSGTWLASPLQVSGAESTGTAIGGDVKSNSFGDVFGFWPTTGNARVFVTKSINGGDSFGVPVQIASTYDTYDIGVPSFNSRRALIYVSGATYRTAAKNLVYAAWTDLSGEAGCTTAANEPASNVASACKTRIWFARSADGGATWAAKIRVNHQASLNDQFNQWLAVDETTGALGIMYYDTVADAGRKKTHVYYQHSFDDGVTWSAAEQVTTGQTDETSTGTDTGNQYGDYNGLSAYAGILFPSWTDRRGGAREEVWTAKIADAACTPPGAPTITSVSATAANQLTVNWTNGAPAAATFNVYRALGTCAAPGAYTLIASNVAGTSYADNAVSGSVTYSYKVTGKDATGACESAQSACSQGTATGVCNLPPAFAGLTSVTNSAQATCSLSLAWSAGTAFCGGPLSYRVYRSTNSGFTPGAGNLIATVSGTSYNDSGSLMNGTPYYYIVRAVDNATSLAESNLVERSGTPTGPITITTLTETFEAPSGFDNTGWTHAAISGGVDWAWSTTQAQTPTHDWFSASQTDIADRVLVSPAFTAQANTTLSFWHTYAFEGTVAQGYDGGTLEYSTDGGATWTVMPDARFTAGLFNGTINNTFGNPLGGLRGWVSGTIGAMTQVSVNLSTFAGQSMKLRWHEGDDGSVAATGWYVDSVTIANAGFPGTCVPISCPTITGTVSGGGAICAGGTATVTVSVTGGTAPYTVVLNNGGGTLSGAGPFNFSVSPGATTSYALAAGSVDINNCPITGSGSATVTITPLPTTANAGPDQAVCNLIATLAGNTPSIGTGTWTLVSGPGTINFSNANAAAATATAAVAGAYTLRWTIANGICTSADDVVVNFGAPPSTANAGPDQSGCGLQATLAGNPPIVGTGTWTLVNGPGTITFNNASAPAATATASTAGAYTLRWTIASGSCNTTDDVVVTYTAQPTTAAAGPDQNVCTLTATLAGNAPSIGTGTWTQVNGPGTITFGNASSPISSATASGLGAYTLRWTIANGSCTLADDVVITYTAPPTTANAGPDQNVCGLSATLAGNTPSLGTGTWTRVSGPGTLTFSNANAPTSQATASVTGAYTLRWTIANGGCTSTDDVVVTYSPGAITIAPGNLPNAVAGQSYSQPLTASGGTPTYNFTLLSGSLPTGIMLSNTGEIAGSTTVIGASNFVIKVTDANGCMGTQSYTLTVAACSTITVNPAALSNGRLSLPYNQSLTAAGGNAPYSFALQSGALPNGLNLAANGALTGTPTQLGVYNFTVRATDANTCNGTRAYTLTVIRSFVRADFDGDGRSDLSVWRPGNGNWLTINSSNSLLQTTQWGAGYAPYNDVIVPGDYDGDGKTDLAIWRGGDSIWYIRKSSDGQAILQFYGANYAPYFDVPVPGDYDGDGKTDLAVWRPTTGTFFVRKSSDGGNLIQAWGVNGDTPVPGDYDGDGTTDFAVWRPSTGNWHLLLSTGGQQIIQWGAGFVPYNDVPVQADYDGDGKTDLAIWRGGDTIWYIRPSATPGAPILKFFGANYAPYFDVPVPGDFDGDGKADIAIWRPTTGTWAAIRSTNGTLLIQEHGQNGDVPVPK